VVVATQVESPRVEQRAGGEPYLRTKGALLWEIGSGRWEVEEIEYGAPRDGEVLVKLAAAGLCHSDYHYLTGDGTLDALPLLGGHEGAGVVVEVGPNVTDVEAGDHVITTFMPACGKCRWCVSGRQNLCDRGAGLLSGKALDGTNRVHTTKGVPVAQMTYIGTFSPYIVCPQDSLIAIDRDVPLDKVAIVGCGVPTGWGSAVYLADVQPGETVVVVGAGGVGMNAVQGARLAGASNIVVIEPVEWKRKKAVETFGATHEVASPAEAMELVADLTHGAMADKTIIHQGVVDAELVQPWLDLTSKGGVLAISGVSSMEQVDAKLSIFLLVLMEKQIRGGLYGSCNPRVDIPKLIDLYKRGDLLLDELCTRTYSLEDINQGYQDMVDGNNLRGVIVFDD
jgi:S-(hydroxymethyl)glutathione dehydrogenase/alcohol dehydrogenase